MCCYYKVGWLSDPEDVHFVPMRIQIDANYSFSAQEWNLNFKIIEKAEKTVKFFVHMMIIGIILGKFI